MWWQFNPALADAWRGVERVVVVDVEKMMLPDAEHNALALYFRASRCVFPTDQERDAFQHFHSVLLGALYAVEPRKVS